MKMSAMTWASLATNVICLCLMLDAQAAKTDVVVLLNGDAVTGEIKSLDFAELRYSTDSMGTVSIEWEEVVSLTSSQSLQVEVTSGTRYFGGLTESSIDGSIGVGRGENVQELQLASIVRITPIETDEKLWQRFEGSVKEVEMILLLKRLFNYYHEMCEYPRCTESYVSTVLGRRLCQKHMMEIAGP